MGYIFRRPFGYAIHGLVKRPLPSKTYPDGSACWGHDTGVTEKNVRDMLGNWTGTGAISNSGDSEQIDLDTGEYMESEIVKVAAGLMVTLEVDKYGGA